MTDLTQFKITRKWPAKQPDRLQLYSLPTPNGVKVSIMLEEIGLPYEPHKVNFATGDQRTAEFLSLNPWGKIPAILDPHGPGGQPLALAESGAILLYLADKAGKLYPSAVGSRYETLQWLMFQMSGVGPMFGQIGYFHKFDGTQIQDKRALSHYVDESRRILQVLEARLLDRDWLIDEYSIVDIATFPWVRNLIGFYQAGELVRIDEFPSVQAALARFLERPAVQRGLGIPA